MKKYQVVFILGFGILSLMVSACGKELSRSQAEKIIKEKWNKEEPKTQQLYLGNENGIIRYQYSHDDYERRHMANILGDQFNEAILKLSENDLLTYATVAICQPNNVVSPPFYYDEYKLVLTPKAKPYILETKQDKSVLGIRTYVTVLLSEIDNINVTGITKSSDYGQTHCNVLYEKKYKATPFGEALLSQERLRETWRETFILYDDGWRTGGGERISP